MVAIVGAIDCHCTLLSPEGTNERARFWKKYQACLYLKFTEEILCFLSMRVVYLLSRCLRYSV